MGKDLRISAGRWRIVAGGLSFGAVLVLALAGVAHADNIWVENRNDKYFGSAAHVHEFQSQIDVVARSYEGSKGCSGGTCGYQRWRLYNVADWSWNGSGWNLEASWPPGSFVWRYNDFEGSWWSAGSSQTYYTTEVAITFDFQHHGNVFPYDYDYYYQQLNFWY